MVNDPAGALVSITRVFGAVPVADWFPAASQLMSLAGLSATVGAVGAFVCFVRVVTITVWLPDGLVSVRVQVIGPSLRELRLIALAFHWPLLGRVRLPVTVVVPSVNA